MVKSGWGALIVAAGLILAVWLVTSEAHAGVPVDNTFSTTAAVSAPWAEAPSVGFLLTGTDVSGARIQWTPRETGAYTINVIVGGSSGSITVSGSGEVSRTDNIALDPPVEPHLMNDVSLAISQW